MEAAGAVDAKSMRPPLLGKLQNSFPQLPQAIIRGILVSVGIGSFLFSRCRLGPDRVRRGLAILERDGCGTWPKVMPNSRVLDCCRGTGRDPEQVVVVPLRGRARRRRRPSPPG